MADNNPKITKRVLDFSPISFNTGMEGSQYKRDLSPFEKSQDVLASSQGFWDASGNFLANIVGSTAINTAGLGASLYGVGKAIGTGEFKNIWDNELSQGLDKVQKGLDEMTPFYNSEKEDKAGLFTADYLTSAGFWGNTVGKGISFIAGAYLGGASLAKAGSTALKGLSRASKSFGKLVNGEEATSGLISAAKQGNIPGWIERAGKSSTIRNASSYYAQKISGNMFEAGMEAKGVKEEILRAKQEEYAKLHPNAPEAPEWLKKQWDEDSNTFGNVAFGLNLLLLQIDGIGLGKTMYGYKTTKRTIEAARDAAGKYVELSAKRKMLNKAGRIIGGGLEEAAQEGGQFIVEKTSTELGVNDKAKTFADYVNAGFKGLEQTLGTKEGQESMLAGFLLGGGGRGVGELRGAAERNILNKAGIEALNKYMLKDTVKPLVDLAGKSFDEGNGQILENATQVNDKKLFHDAKAKDFFNWASTRIEMGRYEDAVEELQQLKNTPVDILDQIYPNHGLTEAKKHMMFDGLLSDMKDLNSMQSDVEINFGNSPYKKNILNTAYRIKNIDRRIKEMSVKDKSMLDIYHDEDLQNLLAEKEELSRDLAILMMTRPKPSTNTQEEKITQDTKEENKGLTPSNPNVENPQEVVNKQDRKENIVGTKIPGMGVITNIVNDVATIKDENGNITHEELDNLPNSAFEEKVFLPEPTEEDEETLMVPDYADPETKKKDVTFVDPNINTEDPNYRFSGKEEFVQASDFGLTNLDKMDGGLSEDDAALVPGITALKEGILNKEVKFNNLDFNYSQDSSGRTSVTTGNKGELAKSKIGYIPNINTQLAGNAKQGSQRSILQFMMDYFSKLVGTDRKKNKNSFIPVIQGIRSLLEKTGQNITEYVRPYSRIKRGITPLTEVLDSPRFLVNGKLAMAFFKDGVYQPDPSLPKELQDIIKTQLQLPYNRNNLGTQYVLMVERPGQEGVYTFIGVKGRKLSSDEKQAYATRIAENPQGLVAQLNKELFISSEGDQILGSDGKMYPVHYEFDRYEETNAEGQIIKTGKLYVKRFIKGTIDNDPIKDKRRSGMSVQEAIERSALRTAANIEEAFTPETFSNLQVNASKELFDLYFQFNAKKFFAENPLEFNQEDIINKAFEEAENEKTSKISEVEKKLEVLKEKSFNIVGDKYQNIDDVTDEYDRVSSLKGKGTFNAAEAADKGTIIDSLLRDFVSGNIISIEDLKKAYLSHDKQALVSPFSDNFLQELFNIFIDVKKAAGNIKLISDIPTLWGEINGAKIAGTIDLLGINDKGEVFIIDLKTSSVNRRMHYQITNKLKKLAGPLYNDLKEKIKNLQEGGKKLVIGPQTKEFFNEQERNILGNLLGEFEGNFDDTNGEFPIYFYADDDTIQQSAYAELLRQRTGITVKSVSIFPILTRKDKSKTKFDKAIASKSETGKLSLAVQIDKNIFPDTPNVAPQQPPVSTDAKADWVSNLSTIKSELNKLKTKEEKLQWLADNNYLEPFTENGKTSNYLKNATGRVITKIKIGNITIPFYISTGQGGKTDVEVDKWYVFFGQGKNGWFNKTSGPDINNQYGVKIFQDIANILNEVGSKKDEYKVHQDSKGFMDLNWVNSAEEQLQTVIDFITPVQPTIINGELRATPEQIIQLKQNIQTVKDRVAAELTSSEGGKTTTTETGPEVIKVGDVEIHKNSDGTYSVLDKDGEVMLDGVTLEEAQEAAETLNGIDDLTRKGIDDANKDPLEGDPKAKLLKEIEEEAPEEKEKILREVAVFEKELARILPGIKVNIDFTKGHSYYRNAVITLTSGQVSRAKWHEAFHAIFDCFSPEEKNRAIRIAAENFAIDPAELLMYKTFYDDLYSRDLALFESGQTSKKPEKLTEEQLVRIMYEEKIADLFQDYMENRPVERGLFQRFFDAIAKFIMHLLGRTDEAPFTALFDSINKGDFANRNPNLGEENIRMKLPNSSSSQSRQLIANLGVQTVKALQEDPKLDVAIFIKGQIEKYKAMYTKDRTSQMKDLTKQLLLKKITKDQFSEQVKIMAASRQIMDENNLYPPMLAAENESLIINAVKKFSNLIDKYEVELEENDEENTETIKNLSLMESNTDELIEAQAVQKRISHLYYQDENGMLTAVDGKAIYDNLKMNLEGIPNEEFIPVLEKLASGKKDTPYTKSMREFLKLFKSDETFRTQSYNAFSNYFVPSYSSKIDVAGTIIDKKTGEPIKGFESVVYANNADNYADTQMETWRSEMFGKELEVIKNPEDLQKYITIQDEVFDTPEGVLLINSLIDSINNKLNAGRRSSDIINMITTGSDNATLKKLAAENIKFRLDLGDLTYKFANKNFYSMLKQNYVFTNLKKSKKFKDKWGVFTGVNFRLNTNTLGEQSLYKEIDPATYLLTNLQLYKQDWYIPQQMENKSTVVIVKASGKSKSDLLPYVNEEINRQTALINGYIDELNSKKGIVKGFHIYDKAPKEISSLKGFANTPEFISSLLKKGVKRSLLPRAYQYINIVGANESLSTEKPIYNEAATLNYIANDVIELKRLIEELGIPNEILTKIFQVALNDQENLDKELNNFMISQYINRMEMLATMNPELTKYKNFVDITKRGAGLLLAGPSHYNAGKPATFGTVVLKDVEYTINAKTMSRDDGASLSEKDRKELIKEIKATDGQSIETIGRRMDRHLRLGRASTDVNNDFYKQAEVLQAYKDDDREKIAALDSGSMVLMVDKTGGFDGKKYIKTSVFPLTRYFSSYEVPAGTEGSVVDTYNGKSYLPYPHRIQSHNQLNKLQALEVEVTNTKRKSGEIKDTDTIYFEAHFASAIKLGLSTINDLDSDKYEYSEFGNGDYRLQQENPSGKDIIKDGTQLIQLIGAFLPDELEFTGEFKTYSGRTGKQELLNDMSSMLANLREFDRRMIPNSFKKLQLLGEQNGGLYVPFIKYLQDSKEATGSSDNDSEFLASKDGEFIYSQNMPHLVNGYEQAFISYFNKNLFSQKTPGGKATLVSAVYSEVMEFEGKVISTWEFENKLTPEQRTKVTSRPLKCHKPGGNVEDAYAEVVLSEEYLEDILGITLEDYHELNAEMQEKVKTILGFRIPTQSHHSMMPCKVVDFAPRHYGSIVVAPAEITYLSGADYDVDSLFFQRYGFFKNKDGNLAKIQLDADSYFHTIKDNKIVKEYMQMNNPELDETKMDIARSKARIKAYSARLRTIKADPKLKDKIKGAEEELAEEKRNRRTLENKLFADQRRALTNILKTLGFPTTEKEFNNLKNKAAFIKDYSNNNLLSTRLNILTSSFDGKFSPAVDKFQGLYENKTISKYLPEVNKDGEVYTSFITFFKHYINNYAGGRAIGASANGNKVFAHLHATNSTLSKTLEKDLVKSLDRSLFTNTNDTNAVDYRLVEENGKLVFKEQYTDSKPDNLSSAVSMTVDNVKEQTLVKFNLNDKIMPLLTSAFGIGIGNNVMAALLLNPATKAFSQIFMKKSSPFGEKGVDMRNVLAEITKKYAGRYAEDEEPYRITPSNLNDFLDDALIGFDDKFALLNKVINEDIKLDQLTADEMAFMDRQFAVLNLFSTIAEIAEDSFVINTLLNLNKELGEQSSDADYVLARYEKATKGDDPEGMPPSRFSFDYFMPSSVTANINSVYEVKDILDDNLLFYGEGMLELFKNIDNVCLGSPNSKADFESRVGMKKEFLNFLIVKAYATHNSSSMDINRLDLVQGGLIKMYEENKDAIIKYPFGQMLKPLNPTRQYPYGRLGIDSFKKLDPRKKDDIMDSFGSMLIDPETKEFATNLLSYIATHDNFRFLGQSTVSFMRPSIFNALNEVIKGTESLNGIEEFFIKTNKGTVLDTAAIAEHLTGSNNFMPLFKDFLAFWFSDNRNSRRLDRNISKLIKYVNGQYIIESSKIKNLPLVTFTYVETDYGKEIQPLILDNVFNSQAVYKPIARSKSSWKLYQLSHPENIALYNAATNSVTKADTPNDKQTAGIIKTVISKKTINGLEEYINSLSSLYDNLNPEILSAVESKKIELSKPVTTTQTSGKLKGKMTFEYGENKRSDVKANSTFDAILSGERTATTRYESQGSLDYWKQAKVGDTITWESNDGRTVDVIVTKALHPLKGSGKTAEQWSKLEGWSTEYFNKNVKSKLDEAWQIEYKLATPTPVQPSSVREYTPEVVTRNNIPTNGVFVFGSNEGSSKGGAPTHGAGAAKIAREQFGAIQGQSRGLQGNSYAVVTKKFWDVERSSTLQEIGKEIQDMLLFAKSRPDLKFYVTKIGTEKAGYTIPEIKSLFEKLTKFIPDNVILPKEFEVRDTPAPTQQFNPDEELKELLKKPYKGYENLLWYWFVEKAKLLDPSKVDSIKNAKDYHAAYLIGNRIKNTPESDALFNSIINEAKSTQLTEVKPVVTQTTIPPVSTGKASFNYKGKEIATEFPLSEDQNNALSKLVDFVNSPNKDVITLEGAAGTGKTTIIGYLQKYFKDASSFVYMAPTHAATAELAFATVKTGNNSLPATIQSSITIDKMTKQPTFTVKIRRKLGINPVIVVDESSMLGEKEITDLLVASKNNGVKVIFMGDEKQIPKVMPSAKDVKPLSPAFTNFDKVSLQYVHRTSNQNILSLLSEMRNSKTFNVPRPAQNTNSLQFLDNFIDFKQKFITDLMNDPENTVMITYTNKAVKDYNVEARKAFGREGDPVVGDVITGYLGYASKQIEKKDIANSIQYTITGILNNGSAKVIQAESSRLKKLAESGIDVPHEATTVYYQLSRNDSFSFDDLTLDDYQNNNKFVSGIFRELHNVTQAFLNKQARYDDLLAAQASVSDQMRKISLGQNYIYNPSTDRMEIFDQMTHGNIDSKLKVEKDIDYGHAITIHKSQGTTIGNVYFDLASVKNIGDLKIIDKAGNIVTTEKQALAYVGLSRSKNKLVVFDGAGQLTINPFEEDETLPYDKPYAATQEQIKTAFNPWGDIPPTGNGGIPMAKLNRSLFGLPEPQDAGPKTVSTDVLSIVINKIKSNFALYKDVLGIESVEQLDNMNSSQVATLIKNFCKI